MTTLAFVGDLMLVGSLRLRLERGWDPFSRVRPLLQKADLCVGNLEGVLAHNGRPTSAKPASALKARDHFLLKGSPRAVHALKLAGFDLLTCANNHIMDYGWSAVNECLMALQKVGLAWSGAGKTTERARRPVVLQVGELRVAFLAYLAFRSWEGIRACSPAGENAPGVAYLPPNGSNQLSPEAAKWLREDITKAKARADHVIVCYHWGMEGETRPHDYQRTLARKSIDLGATAVIGHHPHVLQPIETYKGHPLAYSLGNFVASRCGGNRGRSCVLFLTLENDKPPQVRTVPIRIVAGQPFIVSDLE